MARVRTPDGRPATIADLEALPEHLKGEIIDGMLYAYPRPRALHADVEGLLAHELIGPFRRGRGGPGGWWILVEPGIEVPGSPEFSPDLAAWRVARMPTLPAEGPITVVPDWVCEIHSPTTRALDLRVKRPFYARLGVGYLWYIDREAHTLTVSTLVDGRWMELGVWGEDDHVRAEPFQEIELALGDWWAEGPLEAPEST
ncbi:MAG TPA: Uma2 family endonuclease [Polyangia bacterium]|jgi:Uma2 family endonuclease